jgi:hypothetical protein
VHTLARTVTPAVFLTLVGCVIDLPAASHVDRELRAILTEGDARPKIEEGLAKQGIPYSYDRFTDRYQGIIRSKKSDFRAVVVYVYLDSAGRLARMEVIDSFTGP